MRERENKIEEKVYLFWDKFFNFRNVIYMLPTTNWSYPLNRDDIFLQPI